MATSLPRSTPIGDNGTMTSDDPGRLLIGNGAIRGAGVGPDVEPVVHHVDHRLNPANTNSAVQRTISRKNREYPASLGSGHPEEEAHGP
jgi:hypothetical protein